MPPVGRTELQPLLPPWTAHTGGGMVSRAHTSKRMGGGGGATTTTTTGAATAAGGSLRHHPPNHSLSNHHHLTTLAADIVFFREEAERHQQAGNLEETLAQYLLLGMSLQHAVAATGIGKADSTRYQAERKAVGHILGQLHAKLQSKKDYFHGCIESDDDDDEDDDGDGDGHGNSSGGRPRRRLLQCDDVRPLESSALASVTLATIVGNDAIKQDIINGIVQPFDQPLLFQMRRSFLFYGPPGTGKTMFAKASAHSLQHMSTKMNVLFFAPATDALKDKHVGGTEKKITTYFRCVQQLAEQHEADARTPCISVIFIDEIDSLARSRDEDDAGGVQASATNSLLQMMDGFTTLGKVVVMAATNYPWQLDDAVLSRFQEKIYVRLPDTPTIIELLKHNLREFYTKALAHPSLAASDADAQKRYEMLVHIFGIESQALELLAGTFHVPATYSPSNIRDVCQQVFRKSAHHAHTQGVFYVVLVDVASDRFAALSRTEQNVLHSINHRYASAVTYKTLHAHFPEIIATATTKPANLRPSGSGSNRATVRPDSITLHSTLYVHSSAWVAANPAATEAQAALVVTLQRLTNMHVYVANANANAKYPLEYAIFKPYHVSYGPEKVSVFQTVARGTLSPTDVAYMQRYAASSLWMIHKLVEPFLRRTPAHLLLRGISEVHVRTPAATHHHHHHHHVEERDAAAAAATDPTPWWSFRVPPKGKLHGDWVDLSAHTTEQTALNLQQLPAYTTSGLERFVLWSVGDLAAKATSTSKAAEHARLQAVQFRRESPAVVHTHTEHTSQANARIQRSAFSLHIDMSLFVEAMDARYPDAIRPTSRAAEIKKLDAYWRGSSGS